MKIDSHQHFWKYDPVRDSWIDSTMEIIRRDFLPGDLEDILKYNGINGCVAVQADQSEEETNFLLHQAANNHFVKGVVGWVDLCDPNVGSTLEGFCRNHYFKGVRHILQAENNDFLLQNPFLRGIGELNRLDLTYDILVFPNQLKACLEMIELFPEQRFVIDHLAKPYIKDGKIQDWKRDMEELARYPNIYCKLSGMVTEANWDSWHPDDIHPYMESVLEAFGPERIMYGSDWPVCLLAAEYALVLQLVEEFISSLSKEEQKAIMGRTAEIFYKLTP